MGANYAHLKIILHFLQKRTLYLGSSLFLTFASYLISDKSWLLHDSNFTLQKTSFSNIFHCRLDSDENIYRKNCESCLCYRNVRHFFVSKYESHSVLKAHIYMSANHRSFSLFSYHLHILLLMYCWIRWARNWIEFSVCILVDSTY